MDNRKKSKGVFFMKKQKTSFRLVKANFVANKPIKAKREVSFSIKLAARLWLDEITYNWNKQRLEEAINSAIDSNDKDSFDVLSVQYQPYTWE